ncbi:MAG: hypothetical protein PWP48_1090 [Clostridiales bacterium]|jgi:two-component system vancomycin resistance associated response regulator VraR|nr:hypothetical protein [Clostridiales bacterium]
MPPIKVLVAEDLEILRSYFCEAINNEPDLQVVAEASTGKEAVNKAKNYGPDVILMDIEMASRSDGIEAAKNILAEMPLIKVVFLTVHDDDETVFRAFESGSVDYVLKDSDTDEIVQSIRLAYDGNSPIRPKVAVKIRNEFMRIKKNESKLMSTVNILSQLTPAEWEIIRLLVKGKRVKEVASLRHVELTTIKTQINIILKKFDKKRTKDVLKFIENMGLTLLFTDNNDKDML